MLLEVYLIFAGLAITSVLLAYFTGDTFHAFIGLLIFFFLGIVLFTGALEFPSGHTDLTTYRYNNDSVLQNTTLVRTPEYTAANDTYTDTLGWFLSIAAGFGMVLLLYRGKLREARDD